VRNRTSHLLKRDAGPGRPKGSKDKLSRERVEKELRFLALSDPKLLFERVHGTRRSFTLREIHNMPDEIRRCISSVKVKTENLTTGDGAQDQTVEVKLWDKVRALELCAKALGMLKEHVVIENLDDTKARLRRGLARAGPPSPEET
jgi:hypothetical protein